MKAFCFVFSMLSILAVFSTAWADIEPAKIAGLWLFDEAGGDIAIDSSGKGHDGKIKGTTRVLGKFGKALEFNGDDYVSVPDAKDLKLSDKFTMQAWFFARDIQNWRQLIAKDNEYLLRVDPPQEGNKMSAFVNIGGWEPRASAVVPKLETWTHFTATYDGDKLRIYVDGVPSGEMVKSGNIQTTSNPVEIGRWGGGLLGDDVGYFVGIIDEVAIFNAVLTEKDILTAMEGLQRFRVSVEAQGKLAIRWGRIKLVL